MTDDDKSTYTIGSKIRELRLKNGLTQEELADRADLTKGYISQLENDYTSPSIATLIDILTLLGTNLKEFFSDDDGTQLVFTEDDYFRKEYDGEAITWIVPTAQKNAMEPVIVELAPGEATDADIPHEGEEFGYVLDGRIEVVVGDKKATAKKGETFYFSADRQHYIKNVSDRTCKLLWVTCPPTF